MAETGGNYQCAGVFRHGEDAGLVTAKAPDL